MYEIAFKAKILLSIRPDKTNKAMSGLSSHLIAARLSKWSERLETSSVMVTVTERALAMFKRTVLEVALTLSLNPMTWKLETGSKVNVPGPVAEKSYRADTAKGFSSTEVEKGAPSLKAHHCALR